MSKKPSEMPMKTTDVGGRQLPYPQGWNPTGGADGQGDWEESRVQNGKMPVLDEAAVAALQAVLTALGATLDVSDETGLAKVEQIRALLAGGVGVTSLPALPAGANRIGSVELSGSSVTLDTALKNVEGTPGQTAPAKAAQIAGASSGGLLRVPLVDTTGSDSVGTNLPAMYSVAQMMAFGPSGWDRWRNNTEGTLLSGATARTATATSPNQTNHNGRSLTVTVSVTAAGTGTLTPKIIGVTAGGAPYVLLQATTAISGIGDYTYILGPGTTAAGAGGSGNVNQVTDRPVPRTWRVQVVHTDSSGWTYSVTFALNV